MGICILHYPVDFHSVTQHKHWAMKVDMELLLIVLVVWRGWRLWDSHPVTFYGWSSYCYEKTYSQRSTSIIPDYTSNLILCFIVILLSCQTSLTNNLSPSWKTSISMDKQIEKTNRESPSGYLNGLRIFWIIPQRRWMVWPPKNVMVPFFFTSLTLIFIVLVYIILWLMRIYDLSLLIIAIFFGVNYIIIIHIIAMNHIRNELS
jgi:hypothetical protein